VLAARWDMHVHQLRHYSATELIAAGVDVRTVAGRLGHGGGGGTTTLKVYSAFVAEADQRAAGSLSGRLPALPAQLIGVVALAPEPFDARHHWSGSSRSIWSTSLSALGALEEVERSRRDTVVLSDR